MGLDNELILRSSKRAITRDILPEGLEYPFDSDYTPGEVVVVYWRKNWNLRNTILRDVFNVSNNTTEYQFIIDKPSQVFDVIKIIVSFMNKETWEDYSQGSTIWEYEEYLPILQRDIINLAITASFMKNNPDVYLIFYDSY